MIIGKIKSKTIRDLINVLLGNAVSQGIGFTTLVIISRELGAHEYGIFSLLLAIFTFFIQLSDFGISTSYVKYTSTRLSIQKEILTTIIFSKIVLSLFLMTILFFTAKEISIFFFDTENFKDSILVIAFAIVLHSIFAVILGHYQAIQNFKIYSTLKIFHNFIKLCSVVFITMLFTEDEYLMGYIIVYSFAVSVLTLPFLFKNRKNFKRIDFRHFIEIYRLGFWIFLSSLAVMVIMRLDIMMLQKMSTSEQVGYYSVAMNVAMILPLITTSLVNTLLPKVDKYIIENNIREFINKILEKVKYVVLLLFVLEALSLFIIDFLFGTQYRESISVLQILLLAFTFGIVVNPMSLAMLTIEKAYLLTILNWIQLPLNYIGNLFLIPLFQAEGAAISTVVLRIVGGSFIIYYLLRIYNDDYKQG